MLLPLSVTIVHAVVHRRISQWPEDTVDMDAFILKAGGNDWKNRNLRKYGRHFIRRLRRARSLNPAISLRAAAE